LLRCLLGIADGGAKIAATPISGQSCLHVAAVQELIYEVFTSRKLMQKIDIQLLDILSCEKEGI
jgi:hypothetical protein